MLSSRSGAFPIIHRRGHMPRISLLLANWPLLGTLTPLHPTSPQSRQHFLSSELSSLAHSLPGLSPSALGMFDSPPMLPMDFGCPRQSQVHPALPTHFFLQSLGWDRSPHSCQATALLPIHIPNSHLLILAPCLCYILGLQLFLLQEARLVCFPGIPTLALFSPLYLFRTLSCEVLQSEDRSF